jgi:hypothetical protein
MSDSTRFEMEDEEACSPQTTVERLLELSRQHATTILRNPALPEKLIARPMFWQEIPYQAARALAQHPDCPAEIENWGSDRQHVLRQFVLSDLMRNQSLSATFRRGVFFRRSYLESGGDWFADESAIESLLSKREMLLLKAGSIHLTAKGKVSPDEHVQVDDFAGLASLGRLGLLLAGSHPMCPPELLLRLQEQNNPIETQVGLSNPGFPLDKLVQVLESGSSQEKIWAVLNPNVTPDQFRIVVEQSAPIVCAAMAAVSVLPLDVVEKLVHHPEVLVRSAIARSNHLTEAMQLELAADRDSWVRDQLLKNEKLTFEARRLLGFV